MDVNKVVIRQDGFTDKSLNIPIELKWDLTGIDDALDEFEFGVVNEVIGRGYDFEVSRFAHAPETGSTMNTEINYEFYFYSGGPVNNISNWGNNYITEGFTPQEVYYYINNFSNSFFKLDLYDTLDEKRQKNYITIIIPTQQGLKMSAYMQTQIVEIKKPKFVLDYIGDKEGFFIYWLKNKEFLDISTFYMTAKFFNAKTGRFTKMMTGRVPCDQSNLPVSSRDTTNPSQGCFSGNVTNFDNAKHFYYTVKLDYDTQTYQIFNTNGQRLGTTIPIKWFEYVNP
jgi:hypothetical protein